MASRIYGEFHRFPLGVSVEIIEHGNTKDVVIHARLHRNKRRVLPHSYSTQFTDAEILRDSDLLKYLAFYR